MKLASIRLDGKPVWGRVEGDEVIVPDKAFLHANPTLQDAIAGDALGMILEVGESARVAVADAVFDPLIPKPGRIICVGINFKAHMLEMGREPPDYPWLFVRWPDSQVGHGESIIRPTASEKYDYEGELAVVIGKTARHVKAANALDYVAGYTCFMDGSIRDWQNHSSQFTPGKNFKASGSFGPWLVTADEIPDPSVLNLETRLNGKVMQQAPISDLKFDVPALIEYCSTFAELQPGDVISTGTPGGVGFARKPPVWLQPGDMIEVEIDAIGTLLNPVYAELDPELTL
jgi:2-keto-4-pentenoate hydratase/2-oxohepta-3-ene-1,7-dioic acid hydratase in catechol pathway